MIWILIISFIFILSIGIAFYYDYKADKISFKKSFYGVLSLVLIFIIVMTTSNLLNKLWNFIVEK